MLYVDTSALVPYYRPEVLSGKAEALLVGAQVPIAISHLTRVEVASALARLCRMNELDLDCARRILGKFREHIEAGFYRVLELDNDSYSQGFQWLSSCSTTLRTLDALHLAVAYRNGATLATADKILADAARELGCETLFLTSD